MKFIAILGAAALGIGTLAGAAPAEAQRYGYDRGYDRGYDHGGYRDRGYDRRDGRRWHGGPRYRDYGYGYGRGGYDRGPRWGGRGYGRGRVVCRIERGYYGPQRRCFRV